MRGRPDLQVYLDPSEPSPGDTLRAHVRLDSRSDTPYDAIEVVLVGREARYKRTVSTGKSSVRQYHRREILRLEARFAADVLRPGRWERDVDFAIPPDIPPTYRSSLSSISYELEVRVHIPWWPDRHEKYLVPIRPRAAMPSPPAAQVYTTQVGEHRGDDPVLELSLEATEVLLGGALSGAVALTGLGDRRIRRVEVALCAIESPLVHSATGPAEVDRRTWTVHEGTPAEGAPLPFRLGVPPDAPATFATPFLRVDHVLEAKAVVAFGRDVSLRAPVAVFRPAAPRASTSAPDVPLVGWQRHRAVWRAAVDHARVAGLPPIRFDPEQARATLTVDPIQITMAEERREEIGPCLVAALEWPSLGLDLRVAERRWTDFGQRLPGLSPDLQKRFTLRAREAAQAAHLLGPALCAALTEFDEVGLDDAGALVLHKGGVYQVRGLERFLARAHALAVHAAHAIATLPPPAALASALPAYRRFADRHGATLRVGDLSLHHWPYRGLTLSLDHRWEADRPVETRLWTPRPQSADPARFSAALAAAADLPALLVEDARIGIALPLVLDPDSAASAADALTAAVIKLSGGAAAGPYR